MTVDNISGNNVTVRTPMIMMSVGAKWARKGTNYCLRGTPTMIKKGVTVRRNESARVTNHENDVKCNPVSHCARKCHSGSVG